MPSESDEPYLVALATRLTAGCRTLEPERLERHARFVRSFQQADGGFTGREGDSDLYYTAFALRSLAMLERLDQPMCDRVGQYLSQFEWGELDVIDLLNWLASTLAIQVGGGVDLVGSRASELQEVVTARLNGLRRGDGGFAKSADGASGSMYQSFLALLAYQLVGSSPPEVDRLVSFVLERQRDDGGFVEISPMRRSGTNPTAAAAAILKIVGADRKIHPDDLQDFLKDVRTEAGLAANTRVPFPDGLSTFTGMLTDQDWNLGVLHGPAVCGFVVEQLEFPTGGFRAAAWDDTADVEYTFYGLGCLALAASY